MRSRRAPTPGSGPAWVSGRRAPLNGAEAFSGATLELVELADGRRIVLKHLPVGGDWLTRATGGGGRLRLLWEAGLLEGIDSIVDHTILRMERVHGSDVVVMRDATKQLIPSGPVARSTSRLLLERLAAMHHRLAGTQAAGLCSISDRFAMFAPAFHATDVGCGRHPLADRIVRGWAVFHDRLPVDVVEAVFTVHRHPDRLARRLNAAPSTLLHGDAKLENLGLWPDGRLVAIDWGDLTGIGPPEIDVAWYALKAASRVGCCPEDVFDDYRMASAEPLDAVALDVACVGSLAQMGFRLALGAFDNGPEDPTTARRLLRWWVGRTRDALTRLGPV